MNISSYPLILLTSYHLIILSPYRLIILSSYDHIVLSSYPLNILSSYHLIIFCLIVLTSLHLILLTSYHLIILSSYRLIVFYLQLFSFQHWCCSIRFPVSYINSNQDLWSEKSFVAEKTCGKSFLSQKTSFMSSAQHECTGSLVSLKINKNSVTSRHTF